MNALSSTSNESATPSRKKRQPLLIRVTHWLNVPLLIVMTGSGLQILVAYPSMGPRGATFDWYPLQGFVPPDWMRIGSWLAGGRAVHFAFGWFFVVNGIAYITYQIASGEWRARMFVPRRDFANAIGTTLHYLRLRPAPTSTGPYNGLQRFAYSSALVLGVIATLSGLAIWEPTQLSWLTTSFGGYDFARVVHFLSLVALAVFTVVHILLVLLHPRTIVDMTVGGHRDAAVDK